MHAADTYFLSAIFAAWYTSWGWWTAIAVGVLIVAVSVVNRIDPDGSYTDKIIGQHAEETAMLESGDLLLQTENEGYISTLVSDDGMLKKDAVKYRLITEHTAHVDRENEYIWVNDIDTVGEMVTTIEICEHERTQSRWPYTGSRKVVVRSECPRTEWMEKQIPILVGRRQVHSEGMKESLSGDRRERYRDIRNITTRAMGNSALMPFAGNSAFPDWTFLLERAVELRNEYREGTGISASDFVYLSEDDAEELAAVLFAGKAEAELGGKILSADLLVEKGEGVVATFAVGERASTIFDIQ